MNHNISFDEDKATHEPIAILEGRFNMGDLMTILSQLEKQTGKMPAAVSAGAIDVFPIVSGQTGEPRVELQSAAFDKPIQMSHAEAFQFAHALLETTATAINDAMFFGFISQALGIERETAAGMLFAFRDYRGQMLSPRKDQDGDLCTDAVHVGPFERLPDGGARCGACGEEWGRDPGPDRLRR